MKRIILVLGLLIMFSAGCKRVEEIKKKEEITPVRVMEVKLGDLKEELFYVGDIEAQDQAEVYPKVTGKLIENKVKEGDTVKKDDTIAVIDRDEIGFEFEPAPVTSPINGAVGRLFLDRGDQVSPQTQIATIVNIDNAKVKVDVSERDLVKLEKGQTVIIKVDAYPDKEFKGQIDRISPVLDLWSRTAPVEITIPNPEGLLKPGMFSRTWIITKSRTQVPSIPKDAIIKKEDGYYAFIVENEKARLVPISLGLQQDTNIEVTEGLKPEDLVVVMGQTGLEDGMVVKVVD